MSHFYLFHPKLRSTSWLCCVFCVVLMYSGPVSVSGQGLNFEDFQVVTEPRLYVIQDVATDSAQLSLEIIASAPGAYSIIENDAKSIVRDPPTCSSGWKEHITPAGLTLEAAGKDAEMLNNPGYRLLGEKRARPEEIYFSFSMTRNRCKVDNRDRCRFHCPWPASGCCASVKQYRLRTYTDKVNVERRYVVRFSVSDTLGLVHAKVIRPQLNTFNVRFGSQQHNLITYLDKASFTLRETDVRRPGLDPLFIWRYHSNTMPTPIAEFIVDACSDTDAIQQCLEDHI